MAHQQVTMHSSEDGSNAFTRLLPRLKEGALIAVLSTCIYFLLALMSYDMLDPGWSRTGESSQISNSMGRSGAWFSDVLYSLVGYAAYLIPLMLGFRAWSLFRERYREFEFDWATIAVRVIGLLLVLIGCTGMMALNQGPSFSNLPFGYGGLLGQEIAQATLHSFNILGSRLVLLSIFLFGMTIFTDFSWLSLMDKVGEKTLIACDFLYRKGLHQYREFKERRQFKEVEQAREQTRAVVIRTSVEKSKKKKQPRIEPTVKKIEQSERVQRERQTKLFEVPHSGELPEFGLLNAIDSHEEKGYSEEALEAMSRLLEIKLKDFNIDVEVTAVYPGPVITRFELQLAPGLKVSKLTNLAKDIARSLAVISVRVVEVIPGKTVIGIEIPNEDREMVLFSHIVTSKAFENSKSPLTVALGKDIAGEPVVADLGKMPHILVAGTTGSGKSVGVNAMLLSLLYKSTAEEVRLMLIDPKMLELSVYEGIPHLLTPVITDMKDAANGLRWCVAEMERRYKLMAALGVRNIGGYNKKIEEAEKEGEPLGDPLWKPEEHLDNDESDRPALENLPYIVVVIDEFADMMMIVGKKVEQMIARIAQKARAAGIHLLLATQRPSVDVITGLIKANIPSRIGYQVSSKIDSRTVLDQGGAEQLLGHGDMLYLPGGTSIPTRIHGPFVEDDEVHRVVASVKKRGKPNYIEGLLDDVALETLPSLGESDDSDNETDVLYDEAIAFVTQSRKASISAVQRKLRIGYNRAARMIEDMEAAGVVSEMGTNGQREVLAPPPPRD